MNHHRHTHLLIFFASVLLLLAARHVQGQQRFRIEVDTLYLMAGEEMNLNFDDYSVRYKQTFPFYEDDRYTVLYERGFGCGAGGSVIFEEKVTSWYPVTKNGWLQYEPVHRRYLCDGAPGRIVRTDSAYYLVYSDRRVCSFDIGENPGQIGYLNELPTDDLDFPWEKKNGIILTRSATLSTNKSLKVPLCYTVVILVASTTIRNLTPASSKHSVLIIGFTAS